MRTGPWRRYLNGALFGVTCGVAAFAIALVTGYSLAKVQMRDSPVSELPTPTVQQVQQALERMTAQPPALTTTPSAADWGVGGTRPTPEASPAQGATPASGTPAALSTQRLQRGGVATPSLPPLATEAATPRAAPNQIVIPTATPFVPPNIIPIQPIGTPRP